jgi:hypothetical protein
VINQSSSCVFVACFVNASLFPGSLSGSVRILVENLDQAPIRIGSPGEFYFPMELEGEKIETTISTGISVTTLHADVTGRLFEFSRPKRARKLDESISRIASSP